MLPLFPLGSVLFPGLVLPLHIFEERYRQLVRDLMELPEGEREFGVVAIREGREVGAEGVSALFEIGCTARLRRVEPYEDGRFDVVAVGLRRFRLRGLSDHRAYLTGEVEWLPDQPGHADVVGPAVRTAYLEYLAALGEATGQDVPVPDLPDDSLVLSHLVGATMLLDLGDRQSLLEAPDGRSRLQAELSLLRREAGFLAVLGAAPAPDLARTPYSSN